MTTSSTQKKTSPDDYRTNRGTKSSPRMGRKADRSIHELHRYWKWAENEKRGNHPYFFCVCTLPFLSFPSAKVLHRTSQHSRNAVQCNSLHLIDIPMLRFARPFFGSPARNSRSHCVYPLAFRMSQIRFSAFRRSRKTRFCPLLFAINISFCAANNDRTVPPDRNPTPLVHPPLRNAPPH